MFRTKFLRVKDQLNPQYTLTYNGMLTTQENVYVHAFQSIVARKKPRTKTKVAATYKPAQGVRLGMLRSNQDILAES